MRGFLLAGLIALLGVAPVAAAEHTKDMTEQIKKAVADKKAIIVDVREQNEWDEGHITGATLIPLSKIKEMKPEELKKLLPKGTVVYLHCKSGRRCLQAADALKDLGLDLRPLKLGYADLLKEGFPNTKK